MNQQILDASNCVFNDVDYCASSTRNLAAYDYLLRHSRRNHDKFCLSYVFTKNDFEGGALGLAWAASSVRGKFLTF